MAFVYEKLTEQDKEFFSSFGFRDPLSWSSLAKAPLNWVTDKGRCIYLVCLGGQGYKFDRQFPPTSFYLIWNGQPIKIETYDDSTGNRTTGRNIVWKIDRIVAPNTLNVDAELLVNTVKEVFEIYEKGRSKYILSIEFVEMARPVFVEGDVANG